MNILILSLIVGHVFAFSPAPPFSLRRDSGLGIRQNDCATNADWQATQTAWNADDTDENLANWWTNISQGARTSFANEIGRSFGAHLNGFECGILDYSTCTAPACAGEFSLGYLVRYWF